MFIEHLLSVITSQSDELSASLGKRGGKWKKHKQSQKKKQIQVHVYWFWILLQNLSSIRAVEIRVWFSTTDGETEAQGRTGSHIKLLVEP